MLVLGVGLCLERTNATLLAYHAGSKIIRTLRLIEHPPSVPLSFGASFVRLLGKGRADASSTVYIGAGQ